MKLKVSQYPLNSIFFIIILLLMCSAYDPAIRKYYAHHDDYFFWMMSVGYTHPQHDFVVNLGRFIGAFMQTISGWFIYSIWHLNVLRFLSVFFLSLSAFFCFQWLRKSFTNTINPLLLSVIIFTLPPFQIIVGWAICFYISFAVFLAALSAYLVSKVQVDRPHWKNFLSKNILLAVVLLFCSLLTYQPAAMFYWAMFALFILISETKNPLKKNRHTYLFFLTGLTAIAAYGIMLKLIQPFNSRYVGEMYNPYVISTNVIAKFDWFVKEPLFNALNLWDIIPVTPANAIALFIFICLTCLAYLLYTLNRSLQQGNVRQRGLLVNCLLALSLLFLSFLPNLLNVGNAPFYRCLTALSTIVFLAVFWSVRFWLSFFPEKIKNFLTSLIIILACFYGIARANFNVYYFRALPSNLEIHFVLDILKNHDMKKYSKIHVVLPKYYSPGRYDEFANLTAYGEQDITSFLKCAFWELGEYYEFERFYPYLTISKNRKVVPQDPQTLVIDMTLLHAKYKKIYGQLVRK